MRETSFRYMVVDAQPAAIAILWSHRLGAWVLLVYERRGRFQNNILFLLIIEKLRGSVNRLLQRHISLKSKLFYSLGNIFCAYYGADDGHPICTGGKYLLVVFCGYACDARNGDVNGLTDCFQAVQA